MRRRTTIIEGLLAFRMWRIAAAHRSETGLQIFSLPQLAARLAGGFAQPAPAEELDVAIRTALEGGGFAELESIRHFPGITRAVARTLRQVWRNDVSLGACPDRHPRIADLAEIETRVRANLAAGLLIPPDLRERALGRIRHARAVLGPVELEGHIDVAPVWRPLLSALAQEVPLSWRNPATDEVTWFPGVIHADEKTPPAAATAVSCANPHAEVVEALRWMRELIASGRALSKDIAICATTTGDWDEHFLALATDLPLHFSHGVPALATREGQACGALADVLLNGLSQDRVRRLVVQARGRSAALQSLPPSWARGLKRGAALFELGQWKRALIEARDSRTDGVDPMGILMPVLGLVAQGPQAALAAGEMLLGTGARSLWTEALRRAPAEALELSLQELRLPDGHDPGACAVWCPASHLLSAPRPWVRLLGMTTQSWPRRTSEDPIMPSHILARSVLYPDPITERDRRAFERITGRASAGCVLSRSRRNALGGVLAVSPLVPREVPVQAFRRSRIPQHAFNESDRLLARPEDALALPALVAASACWAGWQARTVTAHDGRIRIDHPVIARALEEVQSATSLRLMLRDPLAFVWRYALGWRPIPEDEQPLTLDPRAYGELVHELLKRTVDALEPTPGYTRAAPHEMASALASACAVISEEWPIARSVPPPVLWGHTLDAAGQLALKALTLEEAMQPDTRSWTELVFGDAEASEAGEGRPWPPSAPVVITGAAIRIKGRIDRLDLAGTGNRVRVTDYKTGTEPKKAEQIVLQGGSELQRVLYALAAHQLLPDNPSVTARLIFLGEGKPQPYKLADVDLAIADVAAHATAATTLLRQGLALPGPDAQESWSVFRLALPAAPATYFQRKQAALARAFGDFARVWSCR